MQVVAIFNCPLSVSSWKQLLNNVLLLLLKCDEVLLLTDTDELDEIEDMAGDELCELNEIFDDDGESV